VNLAKKTGREIPGAVYGLSAYLLWGILPLYWKVMQEVPAGEILAHRVAWSFVFVIALLFFTGRWRELKAITGQGRKMAGIFLGAILISINWFVYIWAVNSNQIVECSLGYYINPLINVALGMLVLKEKLSSWQWISLGLAALGVGYMTLQYGSVPWIALTLAVSFGLYGLVKKMVNIDSIVSLALETAFILPAALLYIFLVQSAGSGSFGTGSWIITLLLTGSGVVTAVPLLLFAQGARKVTLSTMGFLQYVSPSLSLLIGVLVYKEAFTLTHVISFACIWAALLIYALAGTPLLGRLLPQGEPVKAKQ